MSSRELSEWIALAMIDHDDEESVTKTRARPTPSRATVRRGPPTPEALRRQIERCFPITAERKVVRRG